MEHSAKCPSAPLPNPLHSAACSVGLPDSRVALFFTGLAIITRDSTGHLRIQEQHRAICPCLLSAPSGGLGGGGGGGSEDEGKQEQ